jgi:hypothetical protein
MKSLILDFLKNKFKNNQFFITDHFLMRENVRGRYSNFILFLKEVVETLELKNNSIDFSKHKDGLIVIFDENRLFKLVLSKERNFLRLITIIHGATLKEEESATIIKVNTRELSFLRESKLLNDYRKKSKF